MSYIDELIQPLSFQEFSESHLFKMPYAAPFRAKRFEGLISWDLLGEIFQSGHKDCWLPQKGLLAENPSLNTGVLTLEQARQGYAQGRTVLVRHSEKAHQKLAAIAKDFESVFKDPIDIQIYCTPASEEGFDWHYDVEEVFVIQSQGEKEFRLRKNTINPWPTKYNMEKNLHFELEMPSPEIRCHLKAGDWLYIPAGWWHKARAVTESAHLSVGVMARTPLDYLQLLLPKLAQNPYWRQRLPMSMEPAQSQEMLKLLEAGLLSSFEKDHGFLDFINRKLEAKVAKLPMAAKLTATQSAFANDDLFHPKE